MDPNGADTARPMARQHGCSISLFLRTSGVPSIEPGAHRAQNTAAWSEPGHVSLPVLPWSRGLHDPCLSKAETQTEAPPWRSCLLEASPPPPPVGTPQGSTLPAPPPKRWQRSPQGSSLEPVDAQPWLGPGVHGNSFRGARGGRLQKPVGR